MGASHRVAKVALCFPMAGAALSVAVEGKAMAAVATEAAAEVGKVEG